MYGGTFEEGAEDVARAIDSAVAGLVRGRSKVGVAFSGGLDSSVIALCASKKVETIACSAFAQGSRDSEKAEAAAKAIGVEFSGTVLTRAMVDERVGRIRVPFEPGPMDRGLWAIFSVVARDAAGRGAEAMLLGQLADELFGGYAKYEGAFLNEGEEAARAMMDGDFRGYETAGRVRDEGACSPSLEPLFPYADQEVASLARSLPMSFKFRDGKRKAVLRRAALVLGLDPGLAEAPKKAAQYSSGVLRLLG